ncbi:hypothetical protein BJ741DRAFT_600040 [Chytriomyces cf. hyalinus JEL632]|nr:hypothetical protein BJ741DRAFT_600040 [Chytriomyces cf. hyalinus JEL632]
MPIAAIVQAMLVFQPLAGQARPLSVPTVGISSTSIEITGLAMAYMLVPGTSTACVGSVQISRKMSLKSALEWRFTSR